MDGRTSDTRRRQRPGLAPAMIALPGIWAVVAALWANVIPTGPERPTPSARLAEEMKNDPRLGTHVDLPAKDVFESAIPQDVEVLLVYAGSCSSCAARSLNPAQVEATPDRAVVFVYHDTADAVRRSLGALEPHRYAVVAPRELRSTLNPVWTPRFYLLDANRRMIRLQTAPMSREDWMGLHRVDYDVHNHPSSGEFDLAEGKIQLRSRQEAKQDEKK